MARHYHSAKQLTTTAMLLAVGILLPWIAAHGMGVPGTVLLPMHIPVLLCGFLCGPWYGALCGALLPLLNCLLTGMPAPYPMLPIMLLELTIYGISAGLLYRIPRFSRSRLGPTVALLGAMLCGRVGYGAMFYLLFALNGALKAPTLWAAIVTGLPGIVVQLLLIPAIVAVLQPRRGADGLCPARRSALKLIAQGTASCVVIRRSVIEHTELGQGIGPLLKLHDEGALRGAYVVDKIVGRAAAMILVSGGADGCYAETMSRGAKEYLKAHGIPARYTTLTDTIINREGNGMCPMEETVKEITDPAEGLAALRKKREELMAKVEEKIL